MKLFRVIAFLSLGTFLSCNCVKTADSTKAVKSSAVNKTVKASKKEAVSEKVTSSVATISEGARKKFGYMDKDKDNLVSQAEYVKFFEGKKNKEGKAIKADRLFYGRDANDDGQLTLQESVGKISWRKIKNKFGGY